MSSHYITAESLLEQFPAALAKDDNLYALASAIADVLNARKDEIDRIRIYPNIDNMPEDLLDILAKDLKVDWYDERFPLQAKRNLIKSSFMVHRTLGTKGAVAKALSDLYPGSSVYEWFEYGGNFPYFKVILDITNQFFEVSHDEVIKTIDIYKSLRSKIEDNEIIYRSREGFVLKTSTDCVIYTNPLCGTEPQTAMQGSINTPGLKLGTLAANAVIDAGFCGTSLDSLM
jgi:phage tail P2-like protein